ncbi:MAG: T9SS type A sorting domain-containing protein, partial [Puia sp.]
NLTNTFFLGSVNSVSSPLPVKLVSFTAFPKNQTIDLKWETAIETQNDYFTIYRSRDGKVWDSVTSVYGKGNFSENTFYETFDNNPYTGLSYYRLKNTDFNGKEYFSPIRTVSFDKNNSQIKVYPNPAVSTIVVESGDEITSIKLMSSGGQIIPVPILGNNSSRVLNVSTLPSGLYFIQITEGNNTKIKTVIIGR